MNVLFPGVGLVAVDVSGFIAAACFTAEVREPSERF